MEFYKKAYRIYGSHCGPSSFGAFCKDCDEEITGTDPLFYDPDGDVDEEGRAIDCSTYLCHACGIARGHTAEEKP